MIDAYARKNVRLLGRIEFVRTRVRNDLYSLTFYTSGASNVLPFFIASTIGKRSRDWRGRGFYGSNDCVKLYWNPGSRLENDSKRIVSNYDEVDLH